MRSNSCTDVKIKNKQNWKANQALTKTIEALRNINKALKNIINFVPVLNISDVDFKLIKNLLCQELERH